ncbi:hypothetical protein [Streptomyces sp. FL07-04A]|uniref:hypothetical protein n=1 Tax=Streptomyces sp. FL07-04A TaxID=3028658 RepID=UPI0029A3F0C0|nr:hypothetical protein [Streptomyces sp. FL07-04A]MDX3575945.1 hypothetical protein [Streptomyces sp. FL07-04A]
MTHSPYGRGTCPACDREMNLLKNGTLRHHSGPVGSDPGNWLNRRAYRCKGAGQKPKPTPA